MSRGDILAAVILSVCALCAIASLLYSMCIYAYRVGLAKGRSDASASFQEGYKDGLYDGARAERVRRERVIGGVTP